MKKKTFNEILSIDDDDKKIIEMIEENPDITHSVIAKEIEKQKKIEIIFTSLFKINFFHMVHRASYSASSKLSISNHPFSA